MQTETKHCVNCKYYSGVADLFVCKHKTSYIDTIFHDNKMNYLYYSQYRMRQPEGLCGKEAKLFEHKQSMWQRFMAKMEYLLAPGMKFNKGN